MIDLKAISPAAGAKYSPNLHRWMKKHGNGPRGVLAFDTGHDEHPTRRIMLGHVFDGGLIAGRLSTILCYGTKRLDLGSYGGVDWISRPIPGFFAGYQKWGRCYIDPQHTGWWQGERFREDGDVRTCLWCGATQRKIVVRRYVDHDSWVTA